MKCSSSTIINLMKLATDELVRITDCGGRRVRQPVPSIVRFSLIDSTVTPTSASAHHRLWRTMYKTTRPLDRTVFVDRLDRYADLGLCSRRPRPSPLGSADLDPCCLQTCCTSTRRRWCTSIPTRISSTPSACCVRTRCTGCPSSTARPATPSTSWRTSASCASSISTWVRHPEVPLSLRESNILRFLYLYVSPTSWGSSISTWVQHPALPLSLRESQHPEVPLSLRESNILRFR